ncbi:ATP-dependent DNA helicase RecG [Bifidobacterium biavatii]|uniref:ATP-dependent DNA helicase n=1 Tax=Bifidobacterium biavatii DSM 23969 TaxID=1437608 RepID=A0A086ZTQ2_9BIFI|nr:ATP-dependent DNA helicase RecG [Bifidobacterium biavatii]KFI49902.1 ATP-dependent DNA helicase [Bifidobacterium biavatii DSM 23969]
MSITLDTPIASLMTNKRRVGALKALGIVTVGDALTYYPFRVTEPVPLRSLREARIGEPMAFAAVVRGQRVTRTSGYSYRLEVVVDDSNFAPERRTSGAVARLVYFSGKKQFIDWKAMGLREGATIVVSGQPSEFNGQLQFTHPETLTVAPGANEPDGDMFIPATSSLKYDADTIEAGLRRVCRPRPVYHATSRISSEHIHESILSFLRLLEGEDANVADGAESLASASSSASVSQVVSPGQVSAAQVSSAQVTAAQGNAVEANLLAAAIPDILPEEVRAAKRLMHRAEAFAAIHDPQSTADFKRGIDAMRYEEAFICQTALLNARRHAHHAAAEPCPDTTLRDRFIDALPFTLTGGQREVIDDIAADMARDAPMQRLLQGEVGSGKTVVALAAMLQAVGSGRQAVLVAPTQVLAEQHVATISRMVAGLGGASDGESDSVAASSTDTAAKRKTRAAGGNSRDDRGGIPVILLTGGMKLAERRRALAAAASGEPCIIVATHAAFSKTFQAPNLALAVIDEQHRFGVEQRESLRAKTDKAPHLLVMTATPIPRTAAMTWFGDLDISWLTELPGGRKPIRTFIVPEADARTMASMFAHIRQRIDAGERAYVVCPRIDADDDDAESGSDGSETGVYDMSDEMAREARSASAGSSGRGNAGGGRIRTDGRGRAAGGDDRNGAASDADATERPPLHSVTEIAARLAALPQFAGIEFATLTGRDDDETKARVMADFASGKTPILVATTVIEVGVDVPQASCIVIFDADRYGLSQLHQLRGRVGRGGTNSWAFLISRAEPGSPAEARLQVIQGTLDGAEIAQADLEFRGAGDVLGDAQSGGKSSLKLLRVVKDADMIADARSRADALLNTDPDLTGEVQLAGAVLDFTRGNETFLTSS